MGKEVKDKIFELSGPGPGSYQIPSKIVSGPQYILGLKPFIDPQKNRTAPGPGLYDPRRQFSKI